MHLTDTLTDFRCRTRLFNARGAPFGFLGRPFAEEQEGCEGNGAETDRRDCDRDCDEDEDRNRSEHQMKRVLCALSAKDGCDQGEYHEDADDDAHVLSRPQQELGEVVIEHVLFARSG